MYNRYNNIKKELKNNYGDEKEKQRKLDLLTYQLNEISDANLKEDEEEELNKLHTVMKNSEKIYTNLIEIEKNLGENVIDYINNAIKCFEKIEGLDIKYGKALSQLKNIYYDVQELSRDVLDMNEELIFDENKRNEVEERLELIYSLKRKYGNTIAEIINYKNEIENEIKLIENSDERNNELKKELELLENKMNQICNKMNEIRKKYALKLSDNINNELIDLEMKNAKFEVSIEKIANNRFNKNGLDEIEFMISTNVGEEKKSLAKIASGGEMSRFMLVLKNVLADVDKIPVLIFDEIDTGISGNAAVSCGEKIKQISNNHQVICITHQPSIAAKGDYNYFISKEVKENKTRTKNKNSF